MNRTPDRPSRSRRAKTGPDEQGQTPDYDTEYQDTNAPRRRRSQAAKLRGDEGMTEDIPVARPSQPVEEDTGDYQRYTRPPQSRSTGTRPQQPVAPQRRADYTPPEEFDETSSGPFAPIRNVNRGGAPLPKAQERYDYDDEYDEEVEKPKKRIWGRIILIVLILTILAGATFVGLRRPDLVETVVQFGRGLFGGTEETIIEPTIAPTEMPTETPEPMPDPAMAVVTRFSAEPMDQPDLGQPVTFRITTTLQTDRVQVIDENGKLLIEATENQYLDYDYGREWVLMYYFDMPYEGKIEAAPGNAGGWNDEKSGELTIKVGSAEATPEPTSEPEPTQELIVVVPTTPPQAVDFQTIAPTMQEGAATAGGFVASQVPQTTTGEGFTAVPVSATGQAFTANTAISSYARTRPINMGNAEGYVGEYGMHGVSTFRGSNMRQNAAYGVASPAQMKLQSLWSAQIGSPDTSDNAFAKQPVIVQWHQDIRLMMALSNDKQNVEELKEIIFAGNDGYMYFYDLNDGQPTRNPMTRTPSDATALPSAMYGTPTVYSMGVPMVQVGNGNPFLPQSTTENGLVLYNLLNNTNIGMLPGASTDAYSGDSTMITASLIDNNTDTMLAIGGNGLLFSMEMGTTMSKESGTMNINQSPTIDFYRGGTQGEDTSVYSNFAAYGEYVYFATRGGVLQCVNINTLTPVWALQVGAETNAAIALQETTDGIALYLATKADVDAYAHLRRINVANGAVVWDFKVKGSITASPLVGTGALDGLVYVAIRSSDSQGILYALHADTSEIAWQQEYDNNKLSSPIALYDGTGNAWVVQGDGGGLHVLSGRDGQSVDYLELGAAVYGSPAAFNGTIVVATDNGMLHAVQFQ